MTCREAIAILADYLDGTLPPDLGAELDHHLAECAPCRAFLATYRKARELGATVSDVRMPEEMRERLRRMLAAQLRPEP